MTGGSGRPPALGDHAFGVWERLALASAGCWNRSWIGRCGVIPRVLEGGERVGGGRDLKSEIWDFKKGRENKRRIGLAILFVF